MKARKHFRRTKGTNRRKRETMIQGMERNTVKGYYVLTLRCPYETQC